MLKKIESLRKQPVHVRNRYAFWTACVLTLVIAVLWGSTLPARFQTKTAQTETRTAPSTLNDVTATLGYIFTEVVTRFGAVTAEQVEEPQGEKRINLVELVASSSLSARESNEIPTSTASSTATTSVATSTATAN